MNHIISEPYQANWFVLPRPLMYQYSGKIGTNGIALYALLSANCLGRDVGSCVQSYDITAVLNLSLSEVLKALELLKDEGLIRYEIRNSHTIYYELLFLPPSSFSEGTGVVVGGPSSPTGSNNNDVALTEQKNTNDFLFKGKNGYTKNDDVSASNSFQSVIHKKLTSYEIADTLDDRKSLSFYIKCVNNIPQLELRGIYKKVLDEPERNIRISRARYFTHLVKKYYEGK